tara:strand:- start:5727 stop:5972 length:246 start_codon:yes stop_codon:yes gene_type:complete
MRRIQIYLWSIVMEMEDWLYPWKTNKPPEWAVERYNLDSGILSNINNEDFYFDWLKAQEQKIQMIEKNIINLTKQIENLKQ